MGLILGKPGFAWRVTGVLNSQMCTEVMAAGLVESWGSRSRLPSPAAPADLPGEAAAEGWHPGCGTAGQSAVPGTRRWARHSTTVPGLLRLQR